MKIIHATLMFALALTCLSTTGCATYRTMAVAEPGSPKVYSGTRLNVNALKGNEARIAKFRADPPAYPLLDLPFSAVLDTLIFPITFSAAAYEAVLR